MYDISKPIKAAVSDGVDFVVGPIVGGATRQIQQEYREVLDIFFKKLEKLFADLESLANSVLTKFGDVAGIVLEQFSDTAAQILADVNKTYKDGLKFTFDRIQELRQSLVDDINQTIGAVNRAIEARVNQIFESILVVLRDVSKLVDQVFANAEEFVDKLRTDVIDHTMDRLEDLERQLFQDINKFLTRLVDEEVAMLEEAKGFVADIKGLFSTPWQWIIDPTVRRCRQDLVGVELVGPLEDDEIYRLNRCRRERELAEELNSARIDDFQSIYAALQHAAFHFMITHRSTSVMPGVDATLEHYMREWVELGQIATHWHKFEDIVG